MPFCFSVFLLLVFHHHHHHHHHHHLLFLLLLLLLVLQWFATVPAEIAAEYPDGAFFVESGDLVFAVGLFAGLSLASIVVLMARRWTVGGELGGRGAKYVSALFVCMWILYVILSSLRAEQKL